MSAIPAAARPQGREAPTPGSAPQWQREAHKFFGRELRPIATQADAKRVARHLKRGGNGWYVTDLPACWNSRPSSTCGGRIVAAYHVLDRNG